MTNGWRSRPPLQLILVALLVGVLALAPFWWARSQLPDGWTFTGVLNPSPDVMQYRILADRSQEIGAVVDNRLTAEPNAPHIPMFFYYGFGKVAAALGVPTEHAIAYGGALFAVALTVLLFWGVGSYLTARYQTWWVFTVLLFGGGLGAHLLLVSQIPLLADNYLVHRTVVEGLENAIVFDQYRNHYLVTTLTDAHFLFFLLTALIGIAAFYYALKQFSLRRLLLAALCFGGVTILHIYDGVTLLAIGGGVCFLLWRKRLPLRPCLLTLGACGLAVALAIGWQVLLYRNSGIELPPWRAQSIYVSELALAYPIAWLLIAFGLGDYWRKAGLRETFLLGWALGCIVLTLSGPFYPYPDRGTLTLQIPLYLVAGAIYFSRFSRVPVTHAIAALLVLGATPAYKLRNVWQHTTITADPRGEPAPYTWMSPEHQAMTETLEREAGDEDILLFDKTDVPWRTDDLWLAPGFPGKLYVGHYALTVDYDRKREATRRFYTDPESAEAIAFLNEAGIGFVYVSQEADPSRFEGIPGLRSLQTAPFGTLFRYAPVP